MSLKSTHNLMKDFKKFNASLKQQGGHAKIINVGVSKQNLLG